MAAAVAFELVHNLYDGPQANDAEVPAVVVSGTRGRPCLFPALTAAAIVDSAMRATGTSNVALARAAGVDPKVIDRVRRGELRHFSLRLLLAVAHARPTFAWEVERELRAELVRTTGRAA